MDIVFPNRNEKEFIEIAEKLGFKLIKRPKTLNRARYLEIEKVLENIAQKTKLTLDELDLYLWFLETGKILK